MNKKRKVTKRLAAWFMCLAMVLTTINLPVFTTEVKAATVDNVSYIDENGEEKIALSCIEIESDSTTWNAGWYVVSEDVTISDRIIVNGDVHLILADGATLTASKGITVSASANFNVYAQSMAEATMGELVASATSADETSAAGIGGVMQLDAGEVTINGGKIKAVGKNQSAGIGSGALASVGTITINGGIVYANDNEGRAAGIGSGVLGIAGIINLNGGVIYSQGIGAGQSGKNVPITVNISDKVKKIVATPTFKGMCIGKGQSALGSVNIVFKNSENEVTGDEKDAVFYDSGEGDERIIRSKAMNHNVVISDDIKTEVAASTKYAFTGETVSLNISVAVDASSLLINGGSVALTNAEDGLYTFVMPDGDAKVSAGTIDTYSVKIPEQMEIVSTSNPADGDGKYISGTIVEFRLMFPYTTTDVSDGTNTLVAANGIYSVTVGTSDINVTATIEHNSLIDLSEAPNNFIAVDGDVLSGSTQYTVMVADKDNITLSGATINGGIICDGSATITLDGTNNVRGAMNMAGIQVGGEGTTLTIRGNGFLNASGDNQSAGIGLSRAWNPENDVVGGDIVIEGGTITAIGGSKWGAGIGTGVIRGELGEGHGKNVRVGNITIKGGVVKTIGGEDADGIGTGYTYYGSTNEIGQVIIYDAVDMVDASSIGKDIIYMHDDTDVSESKNDYFNIIENGERKIIYTGNPISDIEVQTYTGEAITPKPTVSLGYLNFIEGVDYEYLYTNNVNVGSSATVTVTFKGDYAEFGSVSKSFNIVCDHSLNESVGVDNGDGTHDITCSVCKEKFVVKGNHDFDENTVFTKLDENTHQWTCSTCGGVAQGNHDFVAAEGDNEKHECSVCHTQGNHDFSENVNATTHKCANCDATGTHSFSEDGICSVCRTPIPYYDVSFEDAEENIISKKSYPYGTLAKDIVKPENPEKDDDDMYAYTFAGWSPEIQDVTGSMTYKPTYDKTRIGFDSATIAADGSWAIIDGMASEFIDRMADGREITGDVTINRHFWSGAPSTIVLPFETHTGDVPGFTFYSFGYVEKENSVWTNVVLDLVDENQEGDKVIEANTPYIVIADEDVDSMVIKNGVIFDLGYAKYYYNEDLDWRFTGNYEYRQWDSDHNVKEIGTTYFIDEEGSFRAVRDGDYVYPMSAYFRYVSLPPGLCSVTLGTHNFTYVADDGIHHNRTCKDCGNVERRIHDFVDGVCKDCGICRSFAKTGNHDFSESEYQKDGSGKHYRICALCTTESEHEACSGGTATCQKKAVCSLCKNEYGELAAHTWDAGEITTAATCKDKGVKTFKCTVTGCTATKTEDVAINSTNHVNTEVLNAKDATCTEKGYTGDTHCKDCDSTVTGTDIAATGHDMTKTVSAKVPATCEKDGKEEVTGCKNCDHTEGGALIKATGHKWDNGTVTKQPTVTAEGVKTFKCTNTGCTETKTESIARLPEPKKNEVIEDKTGNDYEVTDSDKKEVTYKAPADKKAKTVTIPDKVEIDGVTYKVTKVDDGAFKGNTTVTKITIPSTVTTIGKDAFNGCSKLKTVSVPKNVTEIGANAFKGCSSLTKVTLPSKTTKIGANAFDGCKKMKTISIKSTKFTSKSVSANAFKGLSKNVTIKVPKKQLKAYKSLLKKKGFKGKVK